MRISGAVLVLLAALVATGLPSAATGQGVRCAVSDPPAAQLRRVEIALRARRDVWGDALVRSHAGPSYDSGRRFLPPLLLARGPKSRPLTSSGFHYLAFAQPERDEGADSAALHVADGSQILSKRAIGRSLTIGVGDDGGERFGFCLARLVIPRLARGYLPIVETRYIDARGVRYRQESFAARPRDGGPLQSFVRVDADASFAPGDAAIRFDPSDGEPVTFVVAAHSSTTVYVVWSHRPEGQPPHAIDRAEYETARSSVVEYWTDRLAEGATFDVPDPDVRNAARSLVLQNLVLGWRYSLGNAYQQFSYPEALDVAQVMDDYGYAGVGAAILRRSLTTARSPFPSWRIGQRLVAAAVHFRRFRDRRLVDELTPALRRDVSDLERQLAGGSRLLLRERYSSDVPDLVYGLHAQAVAWQGVRDMGRVWAATKHAALAGRCRRAAARLEGELRRAVRMSARRLADGSLFVPVRLLDDESPYDSVVGSRPGSYWNLVAPYAFASGFFPPHGVDARGVLDYLAVHGTRLLGVPRAGAFSLYGRTPKRSASGVNPVYALNAMRFLADNDRPDRLVLGLYGQLTTSMSPGTFVSGEAASVARLDGASFRTMYLPPNSASNASFLETLRLLLVHETRGSNGTPRGLRLAYSTPRPWLAPGRRIAVRKAPTSFGPLSYTMTAAVDNVLVVVDVPGRRALGSLSLRVRLPRGERISKAVVAGHPIRIGGDGETIDLSGATGRVAVVVQLER
jgi:hypothetical protein